MAKTKIVITEEVKELVALTARATASAYTEAIAQGINYFNTMERLLSNYRRLAEIVADETAYMEVEYKQRSKDIIIGAGTHSTGAASEADCMDELTLERERSYSETVRCYNKVDRVIKKFEDEREFAVVRMYYFGEDINGNAQDKKFTFAEIADALHKDEKTVRRWRNRAVNDMAVCMFGIEAAVSASRHRAAACQTGV